MPSSSTRDYVAQIGLIKDQTLRLILLRLNDSIAQLKEDLAAASPTDVASATALTALTARVTKAEQTLKQLLYSGYRDYQQIADPIAPSKGTARQYSRDNGAGKSQMVVRFPSGAVQVLATEP
jgi:hypothetical protein